MNSLFENEIWNEILKWMFEMKFVFWFQSFPVEHAFLLNCQLAWIYFLNLYMNFREIWSLLISQIILAWIFENGLEKKKMRDIESKYSKGKQILSRLSHQYCYSIYQTCVQLLDFRYFARETAAVTSCLSGCLLWVQLLQQCCRVE